MKQNFMYLDGQIITSDNEKGIEFYDYQDNIKELLQTEDIVAELEKETNNITFTLETKNEELKRTKKVRNNLLFLIPLIFTPIGTIIIGLINPTMITSLPQLALGCFIGSSVLCGGFATVVIEDIKGIKKEISANELKLNVAENSLNNEKQKLQELRKNTSKEKEESAKENFIIPTNLNTKEVLKKLKNTLQTYYNIGWHEKHLVKQYNKNNLDEYMSEECTKEEIDTVKKYLKNKTCQKK